MTRKQVMDAIAATEPEGPPHRFVGLVLQRVFPGVFICGWDSLDAIECYLKNDKGWRVQQKPVWSAFWRSDDDCGFVSRVAVNDPPTFLSTDSQGRDRRLPVAGKTFYALKGG